jgi:PUA domain protein
MLRVLHRYPTFMSNIVQVDKGAIKHIFSGSHIMAPGLNSEGGHMVPGLPEMSAVCVMAEGKKHAIAIGVLSMSSKEIITENKG